MQTRRGILQLAGAAALSAVWSRAAAQDRYDQDALLQFWRTGNVTLMHISDVRGQVLPLYDRAPQVHAGVGDLDGQAPYLTGEAFRIRYGVGGRAPMDYALTHEGFAEMAKAYGRTGGLAHLATVIKAIRAERPGALLLSGGDTLNGSMVSQKTDGQGMARIVAALGVDAMTLGGELDFGSTTLTALASQMPAALLGQNVFDAQYHAPVPPIYPQKIFEQNGVRIAVIGQASPFWRAAQGEGPALAVREKNLQQIIDDLRATGVGLVVLLSQSGLDADRKLAGRVTGLDVVLSGGGHDALPEPMQVGTTHLFASGGHGRFLSRIDLDVQEGAVQALEHRLVPIFSDIIVPDPQITALIRAERAPFATASDAVLGQAAALLYRRGTVQSTWDDLICTALMAELETDVALAPAFRWGRSILPGDNITMGDLVSVTAAADTRTVRAELSGAALKDLLEAAAEAAFHADPYQRSAPDMMRSGGLGYRVAINQKKGARIDNLTLLRDGQPVDADATYRVAGWGGVLVGDVQRDITQTLAQYIKTQARVGAQDPGNVTLKR